MKREEFAAFVERTLEEVIRLAEERSHQALPRKYAFQWLDQWLDRSHPPVSDDVVEYIVRRVFVDEEHIYPCVDIGVGDILQDGSLLIVGSVAGYAPHPFGPNWTGQMGPFVHVIGLPFLYRIRGIDTKGSDDGAFRYIVPRITPGMKKPNE